MRRPVLAALFCAAATASMAQSPQRDRDNPTCPPVNTMTYASFDTMSFRLDTTGGQRVLIADGGVDAGAASRLDAALKQHQPVDEIWIRSPGGLASEGNQLGRVVRRWSIPTRVPASWWCISACNFMFFGGPIRTIDEGGVFAVHMFTSVNSQAYRERIERQRRGTRAESMLRELALREQDAALVASEDNDFMIRMGISRKLLTEVMYRQRADALDPNDTSTIRCLTRQEMVRYNVVNG
jgi:hypothetical protein